MDLKDQLKQLFPDHIAAKTTDSQPIEEPIAMQEQPLVCKYEKRHGKVITIVENYQGSLKNLKGLTKELKKTLGVGGSVKHNAIILQGDYRDDIMAILKNKGFYVKRVGG
ncbi:translation initiation factor [Flavobacteriaceae bacterium]|jgi:translation initiation factor 1|nr:translation initiation factor [Flavobacteriaceae bacterium]